MRFYVIVLLIILLSIPVAWAQSPPAPINPDTPIEGSLTDVQRAFKYVFDAEAGQTVSISMQTVSGNLNAYLEIGTFEGDPIATDDDSGGGTDALITVTLDATGSYVITARESPLVITPSTGDFVVTLTFGEANDTTSIPAPEPALAVGERIKSITRGNQVRGGLTEAERFVLYWFEGVNGQNVSITPETGTSLQPLLVLYNNTFNELARGVPGSPLATTLANDGVYFLKVTLPVPGSVGGNYAFTLTDDSTPPPREVEPGQTAISYGESVIGNINDTVTSYSFQFAGNAGDTVSISMARAGGNLDSYLYLLTTGGVIIAQDDNTGGDNGNAQLTATLPSAGDYIILATRLDQDAGITTGSFVLRLASDSLPTIAATPAPIESSGEKPPTLVGLPEMRIGETVQGEVTNQDFFNAYVFFAEEDDSLELSLTSPDGVLDPYLLLLDDQQTILAENDDIVDGQDRDSELTYIIERTGYYVAVATRFEQENGTSLGSYELSVGRQGAAVPPPTVNTTANNANLQRFTPINIQAGTTLDGSLSPSRFANTYSFTTTGTNRLIDFSVTATDGTLTTLIITDERLQPIASTDDGVFISTSIQRAGDYLVFVAPAEGTLVSAPLDYSVAFNAPGEEAPLALGNGTEIDGNGEPEVLSIAYGEQVTGTIDNENNVQDYEFVGTAGDLIRIRMNAIGNGLLDPLIELRNANGVLVASNDDIEAGVLRDSFLQTSLTADGVYTIRATHFIPTDGTVASEGEYELTLQQVDPSAASISAVVNPIEAGRAVENTLDDSQTLLFYDFQATSGDVVTIEVTRLSGDLDGVLYLYGYTSGGEPIELASNDDSPLGNTFDPLIADYRIPRSGTYLIAVGRFPTEDNPTSGDFSMLLRIQPTGSGSSDQ